MPLLVLAFICALLLTLVFLNGSGWLSRLSSDSDLSGPQKFHSRPVPRIGGVAIFAATLAAVLAALVSRHPQARGLACLLFCSLPAFLCGATEDFTKTQSPRRRLFFTCVSAALSVAVIDGVLVRTAIPGVDSLMGFAPFAIALTVLVVAGMANAVNLIDGFNGLASMCVLLMLAAVTYVAFQVDDALVASAALIVIGSLLGFFVWNFPAGLIFLGDGGAYFLGFVLAELCVLLLHRNPRVSPIFTLLLCAYPIFETTFTIYRRKFVRGVAAAAPDGIHLHTLIHRRVVRWSGARDRRQTVRNSMTSPYLWVLCMTSVIPAVLWWDDTAVLTFFLFLFMGSYVALYWSIVRFKTPKWLMIGRLAPRRR